MEIIKKGVAPHDRTYDGECNNCETEVRFKRSEAKFQGDQRDGDALVVKCPVCGADIWTAL